MEILKIEGIVISETNYSESSKILNVLTKDLGIIGVISKGCKKLKSNLRSVSTKLTYGMFNIYYKKDGLSTLISVDIKDSFNKIKTDITKISYASFLLELTEQVYKQSARDDIFELFINALLKINEGFDPIVITNILELKYLDHLGIGLMLDGCSICGNNENIVTNGLGDYHIYMSDKNEGFEEYILTLYNPSESDSNRGFFTITQATSMSYDSINGYYTIVGSKIEFSRIATNQSEKNLFINFFGLSEQNLEKAEQDNYYKFTFDYTNEKINSPKIEYKRIS